MWATQLGDRALRGAEWNLFREGLSYLGDHVEELIEDPDLDPCICWTNVDIFDRLEPPQKLAMLAAVGTALRKEDAPCPQLTSLSEGTFAAVFGAIRGWIEAEIDVQQEGGQTEGGKTIRDLVVAAARETRSGLKIPVTTCSDMEAWDEILDDLMDCVLWGDRDFELEGLFLDKDPEVAAGLRSSLAISQEYFTAVAPDPGPQEIASARECLRNLCSDRDEDHEAGGHSGS